MAKKKTAAEQPEEVKLAEEAARDDEKTPDPDANPDSAPVCRYAVKHPGGLNLREAPGRGAPIRSVLPCGAVIQTAEELLPAYGRYAEVTSHWGGGWVDTGYLIRLLEE